MYQEMKDIYDYGAGYIYNRGRRFEGWKDESGKGKFPHFEWVLNADRYDLKINNEHVQYMDVFDPDFNQPVTPQDKRSLEELTKSFLSSNFVEIELELAKKFHLVEEKTKSDGTKITCLSSSVRIEHFRDPNLNMWKSTDDLWSIRDVQWEVVVGPISEVNYQGYVQRVWEIVVPKRFNLNQKEILANQNSYVCNVQSIGTFIGCVKCMQVKSSQVKSSQSYQE